MSRVTWADPGTRFYETGVDRTVLYVNNVGVAWSGVKTISESPTGGEPKPYYMDGIKFLNIAGSEEFEATLEALGSPAEFGPCDGRQAINNGLFAHQQPRKAFSLSYRTLVGSDTLGQNAGYKIHLVYNALAAPTDRQYSSTGENSDPTDKSWHLTTLPPSLTGMKPTAHFVIDSRSTPRMLLKAIEDILYGSDAADPRMPMVSELVTLFKSEGPVTRRNLYTDPRMTLTTGTVEARRNLALNPSYKSVNASFEVRRNLAINPSGEGTAGWLSNNTANWTMSYDTAVFNSGTRSIKSTPIGTTIGSSRTLASVYVVGGGVVNVSPGEILSVGVCVAHNTTAAEANLFIQFLDSASAVISTQNQNVFVPLGASGTFTRLAYSMPGASPAPAGTVTARVMINVQKTLAAGNVAANEFVWLDDCLIEKAPVLLPYFDGRTASADGLTYSWSGTADASAPIASAPQTYGSCFQGYVRKSWMGVGTATDGSNSTLCYVGSSNTGVAMNTLLMFSYDAPALNPGEFAVGRFRARLRNATAPITITPQLRPYAGTSLGLMSSTPNVVLPQDGSWVDVTVTSTSAAPATTTSVRLYIGAVSADLFQSAILEISNVLVERSDATTVGPWFDGNSASALGLTYSWSGAVNLSPSIATGKAMRNFGISSSGSGRGWQTEDGFGFYIQHRGSSYTVTTGMASGLTTSDTSRVSYSFDVVSDVDVAIASFVQFGNATAGRVYKQHNLLAGVPVRIVVTVDDPLQATGAITLTIGMHPPAVVAGVLARIRVDNLVIASGDDAGSFFDGDSVDADKYFYSWEGAPQASISRINTWN